MPDLLSKQLNTTVTVIEMSDVMQNSTFNPYTQNFTLLMADGLTAFQVDIPTLDEFVFYNTKVGINYASQIGSSIIMFVVVLLLTKDSKRRSPLFIINVVSLALSIIRSLLQTLYWTGPFSEPYAYFSGDYSAVPRSAYASSIASIVMTLLLLSTVELSLVIQTKVVCTTLRDIYRLTIIALSVVIALLTVGFRFADMVANAIAIIDLETTYSLTWLAGAALIMETISIWYFCLIFIAKLGYTLYQRKKLGLRQWGPMQIICIMGGCTLVIPSIFAILEYFPDTTFPEAGSLALTLVSIFLPLSSIWAAAAIDGGSPTAQSDTKRYFGSNYSNAYSARSGSTFDPKGSFGPLTASTIQTTAEHNRSDDFASVMTKGRMVGDFAGDFARMGVRVDKSYSVGSGPLGKAGRD